MSGETTFNNQENKIIYTKTKLKKGDTVTIEVFNEELFFHINGIN